MLSETDALDRTTSYERDEANNVTRVDLESGFCIEAEYNDYGRAISATRWPASVCAKDLGERDPDKKQVVERTFESQFNKPKTFTDSAGKVTTYVYDYEADQGDAGKGRRPRPRTADPGHRRFWWPGLYHHL